VRLGGVGQRAAHYVFQVLESSRTCSLPSAPCRGARCRPLPAASPARFGQNESMVRLGVVRVYNVDEGWGVIDGPAVPGGCWVHFSAIAAEGYRPLASGQQVWFRAEAEAQDGFAYRAVKVWIGDTEPDDQRRDVVESDAYHSTLDLTFDESPEISGR
jgi:CspA family cold shock protein